MGSWETRVGDKRGFQALGLIPSCEEATKTSGPPRHLKYPRCLEDELRCWYKKIMMLKML